VNTSIEGNIDWYPNSNSTIPTRQTSLQDKASVNTNTIVIAGKPYECN